MNAIGFAVIEVMPRERTRLAIELGGEPLGERLDVRARTTTAVTNTPADRSR
jgi:hypothetical protein